MSNKRLFLFFDSVFLVFFALSLVVVAVRPEIYSRPISFFILTSMATAIVAAEIILVPEDHARIFLNLGKILLISAGLRLIPQLLYPGLIGIDPWYHQALTIKIVDLGIIPSGTGYSELPVFHLIAASVSLLTTLDYKVSVMASICLLNVFSLVFVFLIGKRLFSVKLGLLAALITGVADWYINAGFWAIPNTLAEVLILCLVYLLFRQHSKWSISLASITALLSAVLIMTHALASLAMSLILAAFLVGQLILRGKRQHPNEAFNFHFSFFLLFTTTMLAYWTFVSGNIQNLISGIQHLFRFEHLIAPSASTAFLSSHFLEFISGTIGILLLYGASLFGILLLIRKMNKQHLALTLSGLTVTAPAFLGYVFSLSALYPQRWFLYSEPLMSFFAALALLWLSTRGKGKRTQMLMGSLAVSILIILAFFATTSPISDVDTPIYTPNLTVRFFFYSSEIQVRVFLNNLPAGSLYTDAVYASMLNSQTSHYHGVDFSNEIIAENFSGVRTLVLRRMITESPFYVKGYLGTYKINYDVRSLLDSNFSRAYDSEVVTIYTRP